MAEKITRDALRQCVQALEGISDDERSALLELINTKKYGLVWENSPEEVEENLRRNLPVLEEVKERHIKGSTPESPNHIIIEGDNLEALNVLSYTHEGKIDAIYIDPPYNTGKGTKDDFVYNDKCINSEDEYRHSQWLSFMSRRLKIAKRLLSDNGVIFISIDDNEQANIVLLCNIIFGEHNKIAVLPTVMNLKGNQDEFGFAGTHEYTIAYAKRKENCILNGIPLTDEQIDDDDWIQDSVGFYKKGATLKRTGNDAPRERRPYCFYPILVKDFNIHTITEYEYSKIYKDEKVFNDAYLLELKKEYESRGYAFILPIVNNQYASWRWGYQTTIQNKEEIIITGNGNNISLYKKQRPELGDLPTKKPKSLLYKPQYSSGNGTQQLLNILWEKKFNNPKPVDLIVDLLLIGSKKNSIILDFFAGSGTTLQAVMQLNKNDGGHRQCILVNMNEEERHTCEEVTYERNKRVINGYTTPNGVQVEGLKDNSLRYYRTRLLPRQQTTKNMRTLMAAATDLLCIKEDLYDELPMEGLDIKNRQRHVRLFGNDKHQIMIIYNEEAIGRIVQWLATGNAPAPQYKKKVYTFSYSDYAYDDDFDEVADRVQLCALPSAIYEAYRRVLPKEDRYYDNLPINEEEEEQA